MDVGVAAGRHVADDRCYGRRVHPVAVDLGPHRAERIQGRRVRDFDCIVRSRAEGRPAAGRQTGFTRRQQVGVDHIDRRNDPPFAKRDLHPGLGLESFGAADVAVAPHVDHEFPVGVDSE
ncbi:hypothetical protein D9M73_119950 [compost metagenome]